MSRIQELRELPVDVIVPNPSQPRRRFDEEGLKELADSLRKRGVLQPVLVRPREDGSYELIAGGRRWRAAKIAGLQTIPALVSRYDNAAALEVALIENMAREDLNPVEAARACVTLVMELDLTRAEVGRRVGRSRVAISNLLRLLDLPDEVLELLERGVLSEGHGRALLTAQDLQVRSQLARRAVQEEWPVRTLEGRARASNVQARDGSAVNKVARVWGDVLGVEVSVRALRGRGLRVEVAFDSREEAFALAGKLGEASVRGSKRR